MNPLLIFGISVLGSLTVWGIICAYYVWPKLRGKPAVTATRPIFALHMFRFVGLSFLLVGVVSPALPVEFARQAAFGDLGAALLALISFAAAGLRWGRIPAWIFAIWGTLDLMNAFAAGPRYGLRPGELGAAYYVIVLVVPLLLVTHVMLFALLRKPSNLASAHALQ